MEHPIPATLPSPTTDPCRHPKIPTAALAAGAVLLLALAASPGRAAPASGASGPQGGDAEPPRAEAPQAEAPQAEAQDPHSHTASPGSPATASADELESTAHTPAARFEQRVEVTAAAPDLATGERIAGDALEGGASADAVEPLRREPGLAAARRGPINLDPQVRGLTEAQVATFVDGSRTFAAGPGRMDSGLSHVNPHAVETVEVVKGPYALTWGAGALSAVRLETWRPSLGGPGDGLLGRAGLRWAENGSVGDLFSNLAYSRDRWRVVVLAGHRTGEDYTSGSGTEVPADFTSTEGRLQAGFQATDGLLLEIEGGYQDQEDIDYPGRLLDATYFKTRSYSARLTWTPAAEGVDEVSAFAYANRKDHLMNNDAKPTAQPMPGRMPPFGIDVHLPTESNTSGGRLELAGRLGEGGTATTWSAGADLYRVEQTATRTLARRTDGAVLFVDRAWPDAELEDAGVFARLTGHAAAASLSGALRWDRWQAAGGEVSPFFAAQAGPAAERTEDEWSAALSARWRAGSRWVLSAGLGQAVRPPSAIELYSDRFPSTRFQVAAEFLGDPGLAAETSRQLDLGAAYQSGPVTLSVDAFLRRIDDYVTVLPDPGLPRRLPMSPATVYRYTNGQRADFVGAEARLTARLGDDWRLRAGASWIRGDDEERDEPVFGLAAPFATAALLWQPAERPWWAEAAVRAVDRQDRVATSRRERPTPGYTVVDLRAGWRLPPGWELAAGVDNLLDEAYADHLNSLDPFRGQRIEEPGRNLFARLEVRF